MRVRVEQIRVRVEQIELDSSSSRANQRASGISLLLGILLYHQTNLLGEEGISTDEKKLRLRENCQVFCKPLHLQPHPGQLPRLTEHPSADGGGSSAS